MPDGQRADIHTDADGGGRFVLAAGNISFPLGLTTVPPDAAGRPDIQVAPDDGDAVAFSTERSLLAWPTPLEINFITGHSPIGRRNVHVRLIWRKRSGATLTMVWRYEQGFYVPSG